MRDEKCVQDFGRKNKGKRPVGRPKHKWEDNIRMSGISWLAERLLASQRTLLHRVSNTYKEHDRVRGITVNL
jgi:hypothetical protein